MESIHICMIPSHLSSTQPSILPALSPFSVPIPNSKERVWNSVNRKVRLMLCMVNSSYAQTEHRYCAVEYCAILRTTQAETLAGVEASKECRETRHMFWKVLYGRVSRKTRLIWHRSSDADEVSNSCTRTRKDDIARLMGVTDRSYRHSDLCRARFKHFVHVSIHTQGNQSDVDQVLAST